jgi:hypothetical protein
MDNKLYFSVHVKDKGGRLYTNENGKLIGAFKLEIPNMPLDSKLKFKVKADIGDGEGGGYYHIASFNSIALALIFINGLKPMFGFNLGVMRDTIFRFEI